MIKPRTVANTMHDDSPSDPTHDDDLPPVMQPARPQAIQGRGVISNPKNRFDRLDVEVDDEVELEPGETPRPKTLFLRDTTRNIVTFNESPDVPFGASINIYRGCEHGCSYCYARPFHEYLGFSAGLDFETRIVVKEDAPQLLRETLSAKNWTPQLLGLSGATDPYQPVEKKLELTRGCLDVLASMRHPVTVITKNHLVSRDTDLLAELAKYRAASVAVSITTLDVDLARRLEPRASHPRRRLDAIAALSSAEVPVGVLVAPIIPGLNDHEIPAIVEAAAVAGARFAGYIILRLPGLVEPLFVEWLDTHYPERKDKVLHRLQEMRGGQLHDPRFGKRMRGEGIFAKQLGDLFHVVRRRHGLAKRGTQHSVEAFRPPNQQLRLF